MYIRDYVSIIICSLIIAIIITGLSGVDFFFFLVFPASFSVLAKLKRSIKKHDMKVDLDNISDYKKKD